MFNADTLFPSDVTPTPTPLVAEVPAAEPVNETADDTPNRHAEAGRKGAHRVHELIRQGRLYEQEHGLKRGRQRLRQLIEEGKLYEEEHGLRTRGQRGKRPSSEVVFQTFCQSLLRLVKPRYRLRLVRMIEALKE